MTLLIFHILGSHYFHYSLVLVKQSFLTIFTLLVALNYQTDGEMMHINQGRFRQNGKAGYVLKPEFMRDRKYYRKYAKPNYISNRLFEPIFGLAVFVWMINIASYSD